MSRPLMTVDTVPEHLNAFQIQHKLFSHRRPSQDSSATRPSALSSPKALAVSAPRSPITRSSSGSAFPRMDGIAPLQPLPEVASSPPENEKAHDNTEEFSQPPPKLKPPEDQHPVMLDDEPEINISKLDRAFVSLKWGLAT